MLRLLGSVSLLLIAAISISSAEDVETPDGITEIPIDMKTAFARHAMEISDLLHMFIALIKKADEEEGRALGLPEITTTVPLNLESASLEELFDRFETAAQSFRTRFLKYLKTTETPYSSVEPTISTVTELNKGGYMPKSKYVHEQKKVAKFDSIPDSEMETDYSFSTVDPSVSDRDSSSEETTLSFILPNEKTSDSEMESKYSTSTVVQNVNGDFSNEKSTLAFILSNKEFIDSEMETDYTGSTVVSDANDGDWSSDTLAFILSNEEDLSLETKSPPSAEQTLDKDVTLTLVQDTEENSESYVDETSFEYSLAENFEPPAEQFVGEITLDSEENAGLNGKQEQTSDKFYNGAATLIFEGTTEDRKSEIETETLFSTDEDFAGEVTVMPFTTTNDSFEEYTLTPLSSAEDYDSDEETYEIRSTTEDDSDEETMGNRSTTEDDSDEETMEKRSTTEDYSDEEAMENSSTTEEDSDEETTEIFSTTEDYSDGITEISSTTEEDDESNEEEYSTFRNTDGSSIEDITELVKILREAAVKYDTEGSDMRSKYKISENFSDNSKHIPKVPGPSMETVITSILSASEKSFDEDASLKASYSELKSEDVDNQRFSDSIGFMQKQSVYSHLDDVAGIAGENYPNYTNIPATSFTCKGKESPGLYSDLETRCQVFHACWPLRIESYLCPVGTTFNQRILSCDYWFNSTCSLSPDYYGVNVRLQDYRAPVEDGLYEYFDEIDIYPYIYRSDHSHPIFKEMNILPFMYKIINYSTKGRGIVSGREMDYNKEVEMEFDKNSTLPTSHDLTQQETATDLVDSVKDRFRELLRAFVASQVSEKAESFDEDSSLHKTKLQERKYVYEKMFKSNLDRSGILPDAKFKQNLDTETTSPNPGEDHGISHKSTQSKNGKEQIAPAIVFKVLETAESVVNKGILPMTRDLLAANYIKLYKRKKL